MATINSQVQVSDGLDAHCTLSDGQGIVFHWPNGKIPPNVITAVAALEPIYLADPNNDAAAAAKAATALAAINAKPAVVSAQAAVNTAQAALAAAIVSASAVGGSA